MQQLSELSLQRRYEDSTIGMSGQRPSQLCRYRHNWLNRAEIEINVLTSQCFQRCIPDRATMVREVRAWQDNRNGAAKPIYVKLYALKTLMVWGLVF